MPTSLNKSPQSVGHDKIPLLLFSKEIIDECMVVTYSGESCCENCIETIYRPILSMLEDNQCTGLVIDKRKIQCSRERKSFKQVVETILLYKNRSPLRKLALVTSIDYHQNEDLLQKILYEKGLNIRLFIELEQAIVWAQSYP
jgi:hypothetical protein